MLCIGTKSFSQLQKIVSSKKDNLVIRNTSDSYRSSKKAVDGILYENFAQKAKIMTMQKDAPALPSYSKSLELSNKGKVSIVISYDSFEEFDNINVLPSKGSLKRNVNPDLIPYVFGKQYSENTFYPGNLAVLGDPYIFRNTRGVTVSFCPYQYNPVTKKLRVYKNITANVVTNKKEVGINEIAISKNESNSTYQELYKNLYINALVANPVRDKGEMLIIAPAAYTATMQPFIDWKIEKGIKTTVVTLEQTGTTAAAIKTYIQDFFATNPNLVYVQLVGDHEDLPSYSYGTSSDNE
jgi:gingipain R